MLLVLLVLGWATTQESSVRHQEKQPGYGQNLINRWPHAAKRLTYGWKYDAARAAKYVAACSPGDGHNSACCQVYGGTTVPAVYQQLCVPQ